jgi:hypothetical protein
MRIFFGQIYITPGIEFPWSIQFQQWLSQIVSPRVTPSASFTDRYGADWSLMFRISAKQGIATSEIRGPTTFKRDKSIEFSVFLPFDEIPVGNAFFEPALSLLLDGVCTALDSTGIDASDLRSARSGILEAATLSPLRLTDKNPAELGEGGKASPATS